MKKSLLVLMVSLWALIIGIGFNWMIEHSMRPGLPANVSEKLPENIFPAVEDNRPKLLLFLHPQCPCSRATMHELTQILSDHPDTADVKIIFYKPVDQPDEWVETELWHQAKKLPSVEISTMSEEEMEKFGVITSGQTLLYDAAGDLIFSGGITISRGHEGDNNGKDAIEEYLKSGEISLNQTPVFGCMLTSKEIPQN